jgi:hypothetical protein
MIDAGTPLSASWPALWTITYTLSAMEIGCKALEV